MRILAIDTSCGATSVAVAESGAIEPLAALSCAMARGHAETLPQMVEEALRGAEGGLASLDRIAVTIGPGSFTGIRIGVAMARAMGIALAIPVVGVSTLAVAVGEEATTVEEVCEPFLVRAGMIARTPRGRVATAQAWTHLGMTPPSGVRGLGQAGLFD